MHRTDQMPTATLLALLVVVMAYITIGAWVGMVIADDYRIIRNRHVQLLQAMELNTKFCTEAQR